MSEDPSKRLRRQRTQSQSSQSTTGQTRRRSSQRQSSQKQSAERSARRTSRQRRSVRQQKPRYSVDAMDKEDIPSYYERLIGGLYLAGALLIGYGLVSVIGQVRGGPIVFPDVLVSIPPEVVLIVAGILLFAFQEPATFIVVAALLFWTLLPRWLLGIENGFPLQKTIMFIVVVYFGAQYVNFTRARARYQNLPERLKSPDITIKEIRSDSIYPVTGLLLGVVALLLMVLHSAGIAAPDYFGNIATWIGAPAFGIGLAGAIAYDDARIMATFGAVFGGLAIGIWLSVQVVSLASLPAF